MNANSKTFGWPYEVKRPRKHDWFHCLLIHLNSSSTWAMQWTDNTKKTLIGGKLVLFLQLVHCYSVAKSSEKEDRWTGAMKGRIHNRFTSTKAPIQTLRSSGFHCHWRFKIPLPVTRIIAYMGRGIRKDQRWCITGNALVVLLQRNTQWPFLH